MNAHTRDDGFDDLRCTLSLRVANLSSSTHLEPLFVAGIPRSQRDIMDTDLKAAGAEVKKAAGKSRSVFRV